MTKKKVKDMTAEEIENALNFSAIGSWAGYIYQGICAAIESVQILRKNIDSDEFLSLDAFDDFAILDKNNKILSLHQCKDVKGKSDYQDAFDLMMAAKSYFKKEILPETKLYFHCNKNVSVPDGIELYKYPDGNTFCPPGEILNHLEDTIQSFYNEQEFHQISVKHAAAQLAEVIQKKVLGIQQKFFSGSKPLFVIAKAESKIALSEIKKILLDGKTFAIAEDNYLLYTKKYFLTNLADEATRRNEYSKQTGNTYPLDKINTILRKIDQMDDKSWEECMQQFSPDLKVSISNILSIVSEDRSEKITNLIEEINNVNYINEKMRYSTPEKKDTVALTGMNCCSSKDTGFLCMKIYDNRQNLNCIYEVRWLTGLFPNKINNIAEVIPNITKPEKTDNTSIFNPKEVGLLPVQDINNGNY